MTYIYGLKCPVKDEIRYIGKSADPERRLRQHIRRAVSGEVKHHCAQWIKKTVGLGHRPSLTILCRLPADANWQSVERLLIGFARHCEMPITNVTAGGEGVVGITEEAERRRLEKFRAAVAKPEVRQKCRDASLKQHADPVSRAKFKSAIKAAMSKPETAARHRAAMNDPDYLSRKSEQMLELWQTPEHISKMAEANAAWVSQPGVREQCRETFLSRMADPEVEARRVAAIMATNTTEAFRARISAASKDAHARPDVKAAHAAGIAASWDKPDIRKKRVEGLAAAKPALSKAAKDFWADPEKAAACKASMKATWSDPDKKAAALAGRKAMWADPVKRAELIAKQKLAWEKRKQGLRDDKPDGKTGGAD